MSNSLKQDLIKSIGINNYISGCKQIDQIYEDAEKGICSNIQVNTVKELSLYNVQFMIERYSKLVNKFIYALSEEDAKAFIFNYYKNFKFNKSSVYCQKVDIKRGLMFNV